MTFAKQAESISGPLLIHAGKASTMKCGLARLVTCEASSDSLNLSVSKAIWVTSAEPTDRDQIERQRMASSHLPLEVFISSTCYDLIDLRSELAASLKESGCIVRLSEDPMSGFNVDPSGDSIESCLRNVEASDVVICILDRRYGGRLGGRFGDISATECEVRHARSLNPAKPILYFVRNAAEADYQQHKSNADFVPKWIEQGKSDNFARWCKFIEYVASLPEHGSRSNWYDRFQTVVELKPVLMKRLTEQFANRLASRALDPNRMVRLTYESHFINPAQINGVFVNVGLGPALNIEYGCERTPEFHNADIRMRGGLREGERLTNGRDTFIAFGFPHGLSVATIFCQYENRFGDKYRIEQDVGPRPLDKKTAPKDATIECIGAERFYVGQIDGAGQIQWVPVRA